MDRNIVYSSKNDFVKTVPINNLDKWIHYLNSPCLNIYKLTYVRIKSMFNGELKIYMKCK
jgi:hypothetical protein